MIWTKKSVNHKSRFSKVGGGGYSTHYWVARCVSPMHILQITIWLTFAGDGSNYHSLAHDAK